MNAAPAPSSTAAATSINAAAAAVPSAAPVSSSSSSLLSSSSSHPINDKQKPFWQFTTPEIERWVRQLAPGIPNTGGMLFPVRRTTSSSSDADATNMVEANNGNDEEYFSRQTSIGNTLLSNLTCALNVASSCSITNSGSSNGDEPNTKRIKVENDSADSGERVGDIYQILDPSFAKQSNTDGESNNTTELSTGSILSRITLGGLVNGLAGVQGGIVDTLTCIPLSELSSTNNNMDDSSKKEERKKHLDVVIDSAHNLSLREVIKLARGLHRSIAAR